MKIVILDGYTENPGDLSWNGFEALGEVTVYDRTPFADGSGEIVRRAKGADILIVNKTPLSAETLAELAPELRYIGVLATGYNVVDTAAAKAQGVPVCNIPTYGTAAVAQFVMALLLELCHRILVLCGGKISGIVDARKTDKNEVGLMMTRVGGDESHE